MNLVNILSGHIGETFYSPAYGNITFNGVSGSVCKELIFTTPNNADFRLFGDGKLSFNGELMVFPSKDMRNWDVWLENQKPATWNDLTKKNNKIICKFDKDIQVIHVNDIKNDIVKSAEALIKIQTLIDTLYGGRVTTKDIYKQSSHIFSIVMGGNSLSTIPIISEIPNHIPHPIMFHSKKFAEKFLDNAENLKLIKDFYNLN